jgi:hypothetical protein
MLANELEEEYLIKHQANREYLQHLADTIPQNQEQKLGDASSDNTAPSISSSTGSRSHTPAAEGAAGSPQLHKVLKPVEQQYVVLDYCEGNERLARKAWKLVAAYTGGGECEGEGCSGCEKMSKTSCKET